MIDTIYKTYDMLVVKPDGVNGVYPLIIEHTAKTCSDNAVTMVWIICGTCVILTIIIVAAMLLRRYSINKHTERERKGEQDFGIKKEYASNLISFLEELSKNEDKPKFKGIGDDSCKKYIEFLETQLGCKSSPNDEQ